jgi:hypothetical protein
MFSACPIRKEALLEGMCFELSVLKKKRKIRGRRKGHEKDDKIE